MKKYTAHQERLDALGDTHAQFAADRKAAEPYVKATKDWYMERGFHIYDYPPVPTRDGKGETDQHDVGLVQGVEVKHRTFNFHSLADVTAANKSSHSGLYPTTILDTVHHIEDNLSIRKSWPLVYWIWSEDFSSVLWIDVEATFSFWLKAWLFDPAKGRMRHFFLCPLFQDRAGSPIYLERDLSLFRVETGEYPEAFRGVSLLTRRDLELRIAHRKNLMLDRLRTIQGARYYQARGDVLVDWLPDPR